MANAIEPKIYYHFTGEKLRDGSPIPPLGEWLEIPANIKIKMCPSKFAREQALSVMHLWDAPEVVKRYLKTGDESLRAAARDAAWDVARDVARTAARAAAWDAAWDAARDAAGKMFAQMVDAAFAEAK